MRELCYNPEQVKTERVDGDSATISPTERPATMLEGGPVRTVDDSLPSGMVNGVSPVVLRVLPHIGAVSSAPGCPAKQGGTAWRPLVPAGGLCCIHYLNTNRCQ
jgi:hypothetical protein